MKFSHKHRRGTRTSDWFWPSGLLFFFFFFFLFLPFFLFCFFHSLSSSALLHSHLCVYSLYLFQSQGYAVSIRSRAHIRWRGGHQVILSFLSLSLSFSFHSDFPFFSFRPIDFLTLPGKPLDVSSRPFFSSSHFGKLLNIFILFCFSRRGILISEPVIIFAFCWLKKAKILV